MKSTIFFIIIGGIAANAQAATVLFENFEQSNGVVTGTLDGQNGWSVDSGSGEVQTSVVQAADQALEIANGSISKEIATDGTTLWMHFQVRITEVPQVEPEFDPAGTLAVFYVNTNLNLVVLSNGVPAELAVQMPINAWTRFDVYCDSVAGVWNLAMNGSNVAAGLPLVSSNPAEQVMISTGAAASAYLDSLDVADAEQVGEVPDTDGDDLPDWWEQEHFGDAIDSRTGGELSGNGDFTYEETYIAVLDPFAYDPPLTAFENGAVLWTPKTSRLHDVEWAPSLESNFVAIASGIPWPVDRYLDIAHTNDLSGFYRIQIHL